MSNVYFYSIVKNQKGLVHYLNITKISDIGRLIYWSGGIELPILYGWHGNRRCLPPV